MLTVEKPPNQRGGAGYGYVPETTEKGTQWVHCWRPAPMHRVWCPRILSQTDENGDTFKDTRWLPPGPQAARLGLRTRTRLILRGLPVALLGYARVSTLHQSPTCRPRRSRMREPNGSGPSACPVLATTAPSWLPCSTTPAAVTYSWSGGSTVSAAHSPPAHHRQRPPGPRHRTALTHRGH